MGAKAGKARRQHGGMASLLEAVGITSMDSFGHCGNLDEEWSVVKSCYRKECLRNHPDKGGSAEVFRDIQGAFETLRSTFEKRRIDSFRVNETEFNVQEEYDFMYEDVWTYKAPSYDFYAAAEDIEVPKYKVELARSARSACNMSTSKSCPQCPKSCNGGVNWKQKWKRPTKKNPDGCYEDIRMNLIPKGAIRIGMLDTQTGGYGRWNHVDCWRVPFKIWIRMPQEGEPDAANPVVFEKCLLSLNEVLFTGMQELSKEDRSKLVQHVMNRGNWAAARKKNLVSWQAPKSEPTTPTKPLLVDLTKPTQAPPQSAPTAKGASTSKGQGIPESALRILEGGSYIPPSTALAKESGNAAKGKSAMTAAAAPKKPVFIIPRPNPENRRCMEGKICCMTGIFPEVGGGSGLSLGKEKVTKIVESFGGIVRSCVSGKTDILIVGKEPGMSKVSKARAKDNCALIQLEPLFDGIRNNAIEATVDDAHSKPLEIAPDSFSLGYKVGGVYNSLAGRSTQEQIAYAAGTPTKKLGPGTSKRGAEALVVEKNGKKKKRAKKEKAKILPDFFRNGMVVQEKDIPEIRQLFAKGGPLTLRKMCDKLYLSVANAKELHHQCLPAKTSEDKDYVACVFNMPSAFDQCLHKFDGVAGLNKRKKERENRRLHSESPYATPQKKSGREQASNTESNVKRNLKFDVGVDVDLTQEENQPPVKKDETKQFKPLKVAQLRAMLESQGLPTNGKKAELIDRLVQNAPKNATDFSGWKVPELKARLKALGLPTIGKKAVLISRLRVNS